MKRECTIDAVTGHQQGKESEQDVHKNDGVC